MSYFAGFCGQKHKIPNFPHKSKCFTYKKKKENGIGIKRFYFLQYIYLDRNFLTDEKQVCTHIPQKGLDSQQFVFIP